LATGQRRLAVAVAQFRFYISQLAFGFNPGRFSVQTQTAGSPQERNLRNSNIQSQIELCLRLGFGFALHFADSLLKHLRIEIESHGLDMPALLASEQIARSTELQVERGNLETGAEIGGILSKAARRRLATGVSSISAGSSKYAYATPVGPPHAPTQLIELGKAKAVGTVNQNRVAERYVEAVFR